jgi:DNA-binding NtrC family response regulator
MIIGRAPAIRTLLKTLGRLSDSLSTVLITGESGTGKELAARALHYGGPRGARGRFIAVNCAAIPESLFEAELFGYERGAFTGASSSRAGVFEAADGGTLFLDEVGELPLHIQPKLLRIIETRMVTRLGSTAPRLVNVRIVSATARDLEAGMEEGTFRRDLFYRLSVYPVEIPALRTRIEDIPAIVAHHLKEIARRDNVPVPPIEPAALRKLMTFPWPGNVRELVNVVERATLVAGPDGIDPSHIELPEALTTLPPYREAKRDFERDYYTRLLQAAGGNVSLAGRMAEKTRKEIYDAVRRLELRGPPSSRS